MIEVTLAGLDGSSRLTEGSSRIAGATPGRTQRQRAMHQPVGHLSAERRPRNGSGTDAYPCRLKTATVQRSLRETGMPHVHGMVYDIQDGVLKELQIDFRSIMGNLADVYSLYAHMHETNE